MVALEKENIESRPVWKPMHMQPFFKDYEFVQVKDGMSVSEDLFNRGVCLPSDTKMSEEDMKRVTDIVKGLFRKKHRSGISNMVKDIESIVSIITGLFMGGLSK